MSEPFRFPYRVRAETAEQAIETAKEQCRAEGWVLRTVVAAKRQENGDWVVTLAVRADPKVQA